MNAHELLTDIRSVWLQRVSMSIARGSNAREAFTGQLEHFFDSLEQAVASGNPAWLDATLLEWTSSPTLTDLQQKKNNVAELIGKIISITNDVSLEILAEQDALNLLTTIMPIYTYALEKIARLEVEAVAEGLRSFSGVPHRLQTAGIVAGVTYVNDSKATNVDATLTALYAYPERTHLILGGRDKASDYRPVARACARGCRRVYLIGEATPLIAAAFAEVEAELAAVSGSGAGGAAGAARFPEDRSSRS